MKPALIIGSTCVDVIINIHHLPVTEEDIHPTSQTMSIGGCAYNVSNMVRLLNAPHTFITPVGGGTFGDYVAKYMTKAGIPIAVHDPEEENGCCYCLVEAGGERTFMSYHGFEYTFRKEWMEPYHSDDFGLTYVCGLEIEEPTGINIIEYLEENPSLEVFYAPGARVGSIDPEKNRRMLALHPILHINALEASTMSGLDDYQAAAAYLHSVTQNTVIITLGENGCYCMEKDGTSYFVPAVPADHVEDTIGAGDSHAGTVIGCLTNGMKLKDSIAYANRVASALVGVKGGSLPKELLPPLVPVTQTIQESFMNGGL